MPAPNRKYEGLSGFASLVEPLAYGLAFWAQKDTFKLAIQGHAALEQIIDDGIKDALPGGASGEIMRLGFGVRLALAESLGIITPETRLLIRALGRIRNDFAHGKIADLEIERARELIQSIRAVFDVNEPTVRFNAENITAHQFLQTGLLAAVLAARASISAGEADRARRDAALEAAVRSAPVTSALSQLFSHEGMRLTSASDDDVI